MIIEKLRSYDFNCPCCKQPHRRLFDYFQKYHGAVAEDVVLTDDMDIQMLERSVMDDGTYEGRTLTIGNSTFRCGNCHEYFKFYDNEFESPPVRLSENEKRFAETRFKPITIIKDNAIMNAVASFDSLVNRFGCSFDSEDGSIVILNEQGKEFRFKIADELMRVLYEGNPTFDVKAGAKWGLEEQSAQKQA